MPPKKKVLDAEKEFAKELKELSKEVRKLKSMEFLQVFKNPWKFMWFSLLKGLMIGLGTVLGASVLVGFFVFALAQISFVPILGDFVEDIISQVQVQQTADPSQENSFVNQYNNTKNNIE